MIRGIRCDKSTFKEIKFKKGFNIILADRTIESSKKDSRNGLGKTMLIEVMDFCLGSKYKKGNPLKQEELNDWTFTLDLTLNDNNISVSRNTSDNQKIYIEGDFSSWNVDIKSDLIGSYIKVEDWNIILGQAMFDLEPSMIQEKYSPTFRSLISYHIRSSRRLADSPFLQYSRQQEWDIQVNNAYLLGLNWKYAKEFQSLRDHKNIIDNLKKASKEGLISGYIGSIGEMEAEIVGLSEKIEKFRSDLGSFKVHPQYEDIEKEANELTKRIHELVNERISNKQLIEAYKKSVFEEKDITNEKVEEIYKEAGLIFPDQLKKRLDELLGFHKKIVINRRSYLETEIKKFQWRIEEGTELISSLSMKKADLLKILEKHGALEEYNLLQINLMKFEQEKIELEERISNLRKFEKGISEIKIKKQELLQKARRDHDERKSIVEVAIRLFNSNSDFLYSEPGLLSIDITESGFKYNVDIKRAGSHGIDKMKIFCYDIMINQLETKKGHKPGFLIHDSTLFDGVDERQVAKALELAEQESIDKGFQYICTLNSDGIPKKDLDEQFMIRLREYTRARFTDSTENGGLLGIRF